MKFKTLLTSTITLLFATASLAGTISLRWIPSDGATGYRVHYGQEERSYAGVIDVGDVDGVTLTGFTDCTTWYLAVEAYNPNGAAGLSPEVSGWPRPIVSSVGPTMITQGQQIWLEIYGTNFDPGAEIELGSGPSYEDVLGNPLLRTDFVRVNSCNHIEALVTAAPATPGLRAIPIGEFPLEIEVQNPDFVFNAAPAAIQVEFNNSRWDINRSESATVDRVDGSDLIWLAFAYGRIEGDSGYSPDADLTGDGMVDGDDLALLAVGFGRCRDGTEWSEAACS